MADIRRSTDKVYIGFGTSKGKTEYITALPHARSGNNATNVREVANYLVDNGIFLDKDGESYTSVVTAYRESNITIDLDIRD